jgi:hypothetical protein
MALLGFFLFIMAQIKSENFLWFLGAALNQIETFCNEPF